MVGIQHLLADFKPRPITTQNSSCVYSGHQGTLAVCKNISHYAAEILHNTDCAFRVRKCVLFLAIFATGQSGAEQKRSQAPHFIDHDHNHNTAFRPRAY